MNTNYMLNRAAKKVWGTDALFLAMLTAAPNIDGTGVVEPVVSGNGYARIELTGLLDPVDGTVKNGTELSFAQILKSSGTATHWGIFDSLTTGEGNLLAYKEIGEGGITLRSRTKVSIDANDINLMVKNLPSEGGNVTPS